MGQPVIRHGKPAKTFTDTLKPATSDDYDLLVHAAVEAIVCGSQDVLVAFAYTLKFPEGFPKGILEEKREDGSNLHRIKAKRLLKWLGDNGYTEITMQGLRGQIISFGISATKLDNMFDDATESDV